jgi:hypothetical protein
VEDRNSLVLDASKQFLNNLNAGLNTTYLGEFQVQNQFDKRVNVGNRGIAQQKLKCSRIVGTKQEVPHLNQQCQKHIIN